MENIIRRLKLLAKVLLGKELIARCDVLCLTERFGTKYCSWNLITKNISTNSVVYSFGVGEDASFDIALIERYNINIYAFDPTPKSIQWVKQQGFSNHFVMHNYGIAAFDGNALFNPPENPNHISHTILDRPTTKANAISLPVKKLSTIMKELGHNYIDILKMDIEGAEYEVIDDLSKTDIRPRQILVEFHHRFPSVGVKKTKEAISKLRSMGYMLYSVSATNEEYSFIRNSN